MSASANTQMQLMVVNYEQYHGSPFDRGRADAYYGRAKNPHKYPNGPFKVPCFPLFDAIEIAAYNAGYESQTEFKDWGIELVDE